MDVRKIHFAFSALFVHCCFMVSYAMIVRNFTTDQHALLQFKTHISDPDNILANNWTDSNDVCNWFGVSCAAKHRRVRGLILPNMNLNGTIPPHLGNLSFLASLNLSGNNFHGPLPKELGQLSHLKLIDFGSNFLNGEIPSWLGRLYQVSHLSLHDNSFKGSIPPSVGNMSNLEILNLNDNQIHGYIPEEMSNLQNLRMLHLADNQLSGFLPLAIYNISSLRVISLGSNHLFGSLPEDICRQLPNLETIQLWSNEFSSHIPTRIGECSNLQDLEINANKFSGIIPRSIGNLTRLQTLRIGGNSLEGEIRWEIGYICENLHHLEILSLSDNAFSGHIPTEIGGCSNLQVLDLAHNQFIGFIPRSIGNLTKLSGLYLSDNFLAGEIPREIGNLIRLELFEAENMQLNGSILPSIFNISSLIELSLSNNSLSGSLPFISLDSNLEGIYLWGNDLSGNIPNSICNASMLLELELSENSFSGPIPNIFGNLQSLQWLALSSNNLTTETLNGEWSFLSSLTNCRNLQDLQLSSNPLYGILPTSISNFSTSLQTFYAGDCKIKGKIPLEISSLSNLMDLDLSYNELSGFIPTTIKRLRNLQGLYLSNNKLQGFLPQDICGLKGLNTLLLATNELDGPLPTCFNDLLSLRHLNLSSNRLHSTISSTFWSLKDILELDLSSNYLWGALPLDIGNLKVLTYLNLSRNLLSSVIPLTIGSLINLQVLALSSNALQGPIPKSLGDLTSLTELDLSMNNLTGPIPKSLERLSYLKYFNVSSNRLEGEIPNGGPFMNFTAKSFIKNYALCGTQRMEVPRCKGISHHHSKKIMLHALTYILPVIASTITVIGFIILYKRRQNRSTNLAIGEDINLVEKLMTVSYNQLFWGTHGFSEDNLLGSGSFGSVYKGMLPDETTIAVKVFNLQIEGAFKSFDIECEVVRNIRHRNLVKVITSCSNMDFKALVLEFLPNGSLERWLYSYNYFLDILQRINIMVDVGSALEYLHLEHPTVIHCDLKPSNVLLDEDMVAHVGDFGISKLLGEEESMRQTMTLATIGYMAPEYGSAGIISIKSDVYSFGILLMEVFTGKKPTDEIFVGEMSMKLWVKDSLSKGLTDVADSNLVRKEDEYFVVKANCISSILELALNCSAELPEDRPDMKDVVPQLKNIKRRLLCSIEQDN